MRTNVIKKITASVILIALVLFTVVIVKKIIHKSRVAKEISFLRSLPLVDADSMLFILPLESNRSTVLIHYNSTCEHCQYEAKEIHDRITDFENANVIFISTESLHSIKQFSERTFSHSYPNVFFTKMDSDDQYDIFGSVVSPHIFVYDQSHKLKKEFKGEVKVEAIIDAL